VCFQAAFRCPEKREPTRPNTAIALIARDPILCRATVSRRYPTRHDYVVIEEPAKLSGLWRKVFRSLKVTQRPKEFLPFVERARHRILKSGAGVRYFSGRPRPSKRRLIKKVLKIEQHIHIRGSLRPKRLQWAVSENDNTRSDPADPETEEALPF